MANVMKDSAAAIRRFLFTYLIGTQVNTKVTLEVLE